MFSPIELNPPQLAHLTLPLFENAIAARLRSHYVGERALIDDESSVTTANPVTVVAYIDGADPSPLDPRLDLRRHSPAGFNWGYGGSGPSQLALAILADFTGCDTFAEQYYQQFKQERIAVITSSALTISAGELHAWINLRSRSFLELSFSRLFDDQGSPSPFPSIPGLFERYPESCLEWSKAGTLVETIAPLAAEVNAKRTEIVSIPKYFVTKLCSCATTRSIT